MADNMVFLYCCMLIMALLCSSSAAPGRGDYQVSLWAGLSQLSELPDGGGTALVLRVRTVWASRPPARKAAFATLPLSRLAVLNRGATVAVDDDSFVTRESGYYGLHCEYDARVAGTALYYDGGDMGAVAPAHLGRYTYELFVRIEPPADRFPDMIVAARCGQAAESDSDAPAHALNSHDTLAGTSCTLHGDTLRFVYTVERRLDWRSRSLLAACQTVTWPAAVLVALCAVCVAQSPANALQWHGTAGPLRLRAAALAAVAAFRSLMFVAYRLAAPVVVTWPWLVELGLFLLWAVWLVAAGRIVHWKRERCGHRSLARARTASTALSASNGYVYGCGSYGRYGYVATPGVGGRPMRPHSAHIVGGATAGIAASLPLYEDCDNAGSRSPISTTSSSSNCSATGRRRCCTSCIERALVRPPAEKLYQRVFAIDYIIMIVLFVASIVTGTLPFFLY